MVKSSIAATVIDLGSPSIIRLFETLYREYMGLWSKMSLDNHRLLTLNEIGTEISQGLEGVCNVGKPR